MLTASHNLPFIVALGVMLGLALLEVGTTLLGAGLSGLVDGLLPDFDLGLDTDIDADADVNVDVDAPDGVGSHPGLLFLDWLHIGRVPTLMLLMVLLACFGCAGLLLQATTVSIFGGPLPAWLASLPALALALPGVHVTGRVIGKLLPGDETSAISRETLVGRFATVITGTAAVGNPAQAKLRDEHGQVHYVLVEPETEGQEFATGTQVILVSQTGAVFKAVGSDLPALPDA